MTEKDVQQTLPTTKEIMILACQTELVYGPTCTGTYFTNILEGIDITPTLVNFAAELLKTYGNLP
jgi:hypothetical protein